MRPSERSCRVAYELASTVGSRVPGFVTKWPSLIFEVSRVATASSGIDSCQSTWESYVHAYSKPCCSAILISSSQRLYGGSGSTVTPKLSIRASLARRRDHGECSEHAERDEADPPVARQREGQPDEGRAGDDQERRPGVDEADRGAGRLGAGVCRPRERHRERDPRGEADHGGCGYEEDEGQRKREQDRPRAAQHEARGDPARGVVA